VLLIRVERLIGVYPTLDADQQADCSYAIDQLVDTRASLPSDDPTVRAGDRRLRSMLPDILRTFGRDISACLAYTPPVTYDIDADKYRR